MYEADVVNLARLSLVLASQRLQLGVGQEHTELLHAAPEHLRRQLPSVAARVQGVCDASGRTSARAMSGIGRTASACR